jgi:predicted MFS family arabinose efflux permease
LIGALLFAWLGGWAVALLDSASFFVAAAVIAALRVHEDAPEAEDSHFWAQLTAGMRHLAGDRVLKHTLIGFGLCVLVIGFTESAVYALLDAFDRPATFVAVIVSVQGVGAVVGGFSSPWVVRRVGEVAACAVGLALIAVGALVIAATRDIVVVCLAAAVFGAALPLFTVAFMTLLQRRTPQAIMGRASTAVEIVMAAPQAVSLAVGSLLVVLISYRLIFAVMGAVTAFAALYLVVVLHGQISADRRRPPDDVAGPETPELAVPLTPTEL